MISEGTGIADAIVMREKRVGEKITAEEKEGDHGVPSYIYKSNIQSSIFNLDSRII